MSHSPDLGKQLASLAQEATTLQSQIAHRTSELQAVQKKLNSLQAKFDSETARLATEQETTLKKVITPLEAELQRLKGDIIKQNRLLTGNIPKIQAQKDEIRALEETASVKQNDLVAANTQLMSAMQQSRRIIEAVKASETQLQGLQRDIGAAEEQKRAFGAELEVLQGTKDSLGHKIATLDADYEQKAAEKAKIVAILDAKILNLSQQAEEFERQEEASRQNLAEWQKVLEVRDKNLRVREIKVEQGESKLVANANLMNL